MGRDIGRGTPLRQPVGDCRKRRHDLRHAQRQLQDSNRYIEIKAPTEGAAPEIMHLPGAALVTGFTGKRQGRRAEDGKRGIPAGAHGSLGADKRQ